MNLICMIPLAGHISKPTSHLRSALSIPTLSVQPTVSSEYHWELVALQKEGLGRQLAIQQGKSLLAVGTPAIVADFGWGAYDRIIDVAGAHGAVLAAIMAANPRLRGVLFDLPQVIERAKEVRKSHILTILIGPPSRPYSAHMPHASKPPVPQKAALKPSTPSARP